MYQFLTIIAVVMILGFLSKCFILWLSAKIIRASGGSWANCVKLNWIYIWTAFLLGVICVLVPLFGRDTSSLVFVALALVVAAWYLIRTTMDILEIGFLMFILFCIVEAIIESAISFGLFSFDKFFPFIEQFKDLVESFAGKF